MKNLFQSFEFLTVMCALGIVAGAMLIIRPDMVSDSLIALLGITWVLDGIHYGLRAVKKRLEDKINGDNKKTEI